MKDYKETLRRELYVPCLYHAQKGKINTEKTLEVAAKRAEELDIHCILVSSTSGESGLMAAKLMTERSVIVVTHSTGFAKPDHQQLLPELRKQIEEAGGRSSPASMPSAVWVGLSGRSWAHMRWMKLWLSRYGLLAKERKWLSRSLSWLPMPDWYRHKPPVFL